MTYLFEYGGQMQGIADVLLEQVGYKTDGLFVEVGAFNGINFSITWELAEMGWRGLCFEPNLEYFRECVHNHLKHNVVVVQQAISDYSGTIDLYIGGTLSTTRRELISIYSSLAWAAHVGLNEAKFITVQCVTLDLALAAYNWPDRFDLLVVDVEGGEPEVFKGLDLSRYRPEVIVVETHELLDEPRLNWKARLVTPMLDFYGYRHVFGNCVNSVYVSAQ